MDVILIGSVFILCLLGILAIYSATHINPQTGAFSAVYIRKQLIWLAVAVPLCIAVARFDYHRVLQRQWLIYAGNLLLLLAVLKLGSHEVKGAQRWINLGGFGLQPSELAKVAITITLAAYLAARQGVMGRFSTVLISLAHVLVPVVIIFKQPDLGTALVIMTIWLVMTFVAGARPVHLGALLITGLTLFAILWMAGGIKQYQKDRFRVFFNTAEDRQGVGYHVNQAMNAIGSGRLWGKGWLHGTQGQLGYIPEQHTDFIFTIVGEELGFVGSSLLVICYAVFLWRGCAIALGAPDAEGRLLATGIVAMFLYHVVVNLGMTIGIMPVTGVPLPFMSYGGSSLIINLCAVGLLQSVRSQQPRLAL